MKDMFMFIGAVLVVVLVWLALMNWLSGFSPLGFIHIKEPKGKGKA